MGLDSYINTFGAVCKQKYGARVKKITIDAKFTCPNRDGTLGRGGCTFCNVDSFAPTQLAPLSIEAQLAQGKMNFAAKRQSRKSSLRGSAEDKYIAYFQAYTSTYDEYEQLKRRYDEAVADGQVVGLHVGTRPDCVPDDVLDLLVSYQNQGLDVWLELGLQTANDQTLKRINRGHQFEQYAETVRRARALGIKVCTHLILGLPKETHQDYLDTLNKVLAVGVDGLKIHPLHIVQGSVMARAWEQGKLATISIDDYAHSVGEMLRFIPASIIMHRVTAYAGRPMLLAPDWCSYRWQGLMAIEADLAEHGGQGAYTQMPFVSADVAQ